MDRFAHDLDQFANGQSNGSPPIAKLCEWTRRNPTTPLTLVLAASIACVEPHYLSGLFRRHTGITFSRWNQLRRLHTACAMLDAGERSVEPILTATGYQDARSLRRLMQRHRSKVLNSCP